MRAARRLVARRGWPAERRARAPRSRRSFPPRTRTWAARPPVSSGELSEPAGLPRDGGAQPPPADPVDLYRAGKEALLAANVAEAEGRTLLAFEDTGAYRLLLPAMSEDPGELERFYDETVSRWPPMTSSTRRSWC